MKKYYLLSLFLLAILMFGCKSASNDTSTEEDDGIPGDILALMQQIEGFVPYQDIYGTSTITGWFTEENSQYGLIEAEIVNFEWESYSGTEKRTLYRDFEAEKKYTDYKDWLQNLNKRFDLVTITISPTSKAATIALSRYLNFPVKFSYTLVFDDQTIHSLQVDDCDGTMSIDAEYIEEAGIYKLLYNLDGVIGTATFPVKRN